MRGDYHEDGQGDAADFNLYIQQWRKNVSRNRQTSSDEYNARTDHELI
jgi:hypothetical protein